ncbi:MAG: hypothetical protein JNG86_01000 [Verrucomicrobiaceae bacterium]|nr:hypothetical protein [Verrucomicrobiaceae bacterium]
MSRSFPIFLIFLSVLLSRPDAPAQAPTVDRVSQDHTLQEAMRLSRPRKPVAKPTTTSFSQAEIDLLDHEFGRQNVTGIVQEQDEWLLLLEANATYTTNAALVDSPTIAAWIARPGLRAAWMPRLSENWSMLAMSYYSLWRYSRASFLDFDDFGGQIGLQYQSSGTWIPGGLPENSGWLQYRYQRQMQPWDWGQGLFDTHFIEAGLRRACKLAPQIGAWLGTNAAFSLEGRPDLFRRHEYSVQAGSQWQISPRLALTGIYRLAWFKTVETRRDDYNHFFLLGLNYQLTRHLQASLFVNGVHNISDVQIFDYQALNTGAGASLSLSW